MPILDIQRGLREVGRIRCGDQVVRSNGKRAPRKLDHFRITSDDEALVQQVAQLYGGEVTKWKDAPIGDQWQVYTTAERIPVVIVPGLEVLTQWHELWSGGGCVRRCDGATEQISHRRCLCLAEGERQCKPTTRLSVVLPEVPGLGVWRLESHGYYAARELGGQLALVDRVVRTGAVVVASLRLTTREDRRPGQPIKRYLVPALDVSQTMAQLAAAAELPALDGATPLDTSTMYTPNAAAVAAEAAAAALPTPDSVAAAEERRITMEANKRAAGKAKPDLSSGRRRAVRTTTPAPPVPDDSGPMSEAMHRALEASFREAGLDDRADIKALCEAMSNRSLVHSNDMTANEGAAVLDALTAVIAGTHMFMLSDETLRPVGIQPCPPPPPHVEPELPL